MAVKDVALPYAVMMARPPSEKDIVPPTIAGVNVVPIPLIVAPDCDASPVEYVALVGTVFPVRIALSIVGASEKTRLLEVVPVGPLAV